MLGIGSNEASARVAVIVPMTEASGGASMIVVLGVSMTVAFDSSVCLNQRNVRKNATDVNKNADSPRYEAMMSSKKPSQVRLRFHGVAE